MVNNTLGAVVYNWVEIRNWDPLTLCVGCIATSLSSPGMNCHVIVYSHPVCHVILPFWPVMTVIKQGRESPRRLLATSFKLKHPHINSSSCCHHVSFLLRSVSGWRGQARDLEAVVVPVLARCRVTWQLTGILVIHQIPHHLLSRRQSEYHVYLRRYPLHTDSLILIFTPLIALSSW